MKPVKQEDHLGCGVACVAFKLNIPYKKSLLLFRRGEEKVKNKGFLCKDIVEALKKGKLRYKYSFIKNKIRNKIYRPGTIVFLKRFKKYPVGHYLCRLDRKWMDPWINFPNNKIEAGFRKKLPEKPIYFIYSY